SGRHPAAVWCVRGASRAGGRVQVHSRQLTGQRANGSTTMRAIISIAALSFLAGCTGSAKNDPRDDLYAPTGTFSIIAYDTATGEWGGAVQSRVFSVGNGVLWAEANVGIVATQAIVDVSYGPQALALLRQGKSASEVVKAVWEHDPDPL